MKKSTKKATAKSVAKKRSKPFVYDTTVWDSVNGGFSNPGERRICTVGKHKVLVERAQRLDRYGNPVHTATVINKNGSAGASYRSNGSATFIVSEALRRNGIDVKHRARKKRK